MSDLKKCPFCDKEPNLNSEITDVGFGTVQTKCHGFLGLSNEIVHKPSGLFVIYFWVNCSHCGTRCNSFNTEYEAIKNWNKRATK